MKKTNQEEKASAVRYIMYNGEKRYELHFFGETANQVIQTQPLKNLIIVYNDRSLEICNDFVDDVIIDKEPSKRGRKKKSELPYTTKKCYDDEQNLWLEIRYFDKEHYAENKNIQFLYIETALGYLAHCPKINVPPVQQVQDVPDVPPVEVEKGKKKTKPLKKK